MQTMAALSVTQPWASLIIMGEKIYETRDWSTNYRGPLVIHAPKTFPAWAKELCQMDPFRHVLRAHGLDVAQLPLGMALGTVQMDACLRTLDIRGDLSAHERAFGDFSQGRQALRLSQPRPFLHPVLMRGNRGIFEVKLEISEAWYAADVHDARLRTP